MITEKIESLRDCLKMTQWKLSMIRNGRGRIDPREKGDWWNRAASERHQLALSLGFS